MSRDQRYLEISRCGCCLLIRVLRSVLTCPWPWPVPLVLTDGRTLFGGKKSWRKEMKEWRKWREGVLSGFRTSGLSGFGSMDDDVYTSYTPPSSAAIARHGPCYKHNLVPPSNKCRFLDFAHKTRTKPKFRCRRIALTPISITPRIFNQFY